MFVSLVGCLFVCAAVRLVVCLVVCLFDFVFLNWLNVCLLVCACLLVFV